MSNFIIKKNVLLAGSNAGDGMSFSPAINLRSYDVATGNMLSDFLKPGAPQFFSGSDNIYNYCQLGPDGNLYVQVWSGSIEVFNAQNGNWLRTAYSAQQYGSNFTFDQNGQLLVVHWTFDILIVDPLTAIVTGTFIQNKNNTLDGAAVLRFFPHGDLFILCTHFGTSIRRYDANTGAFVKEILPLNNVLLNGSGDFIFGPDKFIYATSFFNDEVVRINPDSGAKTGTISGGTMTRPNGLAFDKDKNLYVSSANQSAIFRFKAKTFTPFGSGLLPGGLFASNTYSPVTFITFLDDVNVPNIQALKYIGMLVSLVFSGQDDNTGGIGSITPGKGGPKHYPGPIPPEDAWRFWQSISKEEQDAITAYGISLFSTFLNNRSAAKEIRNTVKQFLGKRFAYLEGLLKEINNTKRG